MAEEKIKAIAVDDEKHCLTTLKFELKRFCPNVELIDTIQDADMAMERLPKTEFDLLFLDINLQTISGIELLEQMMPVDFEVIFVTAYDEYAIKAFDLSAMHYLLKPVNGKKLKSAVDKVIEKRKSSGNVEEYKEMLMSLKDEINQSNKLAVPVHDGIEFVTPNEVVYVKGDGNYSIFHFKDGKKMAVSKTLKSIEDKLTNHSFMRIHKSHLININELVKYVKNEGGYVVLSNGVKLGVSRNKKQMLNDLFQ